MSLRRPRNNDSSVIPPAKRRQVIVDNAVSKLTRNLKTKLSLPKNKYNLGTITNLNNSTMGVRLSRKFVNELKQIYNLSYQKQIEYVGSTAFTVQNTRGVVKFATPTASTNGSFTKVRPRNVDLQSYVVYHTHPVPKGRSDLFTLPSFTDFTAYIEFYPYIQANIILEKNGYYVIDLIESDRFKKPKMTDLINFYKTEIIQRGKFGNVLEVHRNVEYWKSDVKAWSRAINKYVNDRMVARFGISVRYYTYDQLAPITLMDKNIIMLP